MANIREAILGCLEVRAEAGLPLTVRTMEVEVAAASPHAPCPIIES